MLLEIMGLQLPGSSFVNPGTPLRDALTDLAVERVLALGREGVGMADIVSERNVVNGIVGLLATGGSTNHTIHLVAMAQAAGIRIDWDDFAELSTVVPLLAHIPERQGGCEPLPCRRWQRASLIAQLLAAGLLHCDVHTVMGPGLDRYTREPWLHDGQLAWRAAPAVSADPAVLRPVADPFSPDGGLRLLQGNLGRSVVKVSAVARSIGACTRRPSSSKARRP